MMQMLAAGGMTILSDNERKPDADNPRGYCEWEPAKLLPTQPARIDEAEGKAVKVITQLLMSIPPGRDYRVIFMERPLPEVLASQDEMLRRRGKSDITSHEVMAKAFTSHMKDIVSWFESRSEIPVLRLGYRRLLQNPLPWAKAVKDFLQHELDVEAMAHQVDPSLYRNRSS